MSTSSHSYSLKIRLLRVLLGSLTLLLAVGSIGMYILQRELLQNEFDRESFRRVGEVMRDVYRHGIDATVLPERLLIVQWVSSDDEKSSWSLPQSAESLTDIGILSMPQTDRPEIVDTKLPDGREVRVFVRHFKPMGRRRDGGPDSGPDGGPDIGPGGGPEGPPPPQEVTQNAEEVESGIKEDRRARPQRRRSPPHGVMIAVADRSDLDAALRRWMSILLICCAAGEVLVVAVVLMAVRRGLAPLQPLAEDISSIDSRRLSSRVSTRSMPSELEPVVAQVNSLLERLEAAFMREQDFTASAAHELRTPLAGMRTQLEVLLRRERDCEDYRRNALQCLDAVKSLHAMVDSMLDLARLDSADARLELEELDLGELARRLWDALAAENSSSSSENPEKHLRLRLESPVPVSINSDRGLLERILGNLLANAIEYGDAEGADGGAGGAGGAGGDAGGAGGAGVAGVAGGEIVLHLRKHAGLVVMELSNTASQLNPGDMDKLFDRLWRGDKARSEAATHCGLGLSIVSRSVELLGGEITCSLRQSVVTFRVELPA